MWWFQTFSYVHPYLGEMVQFDKYVSIGLKPPTRYDFTCGVLIFQRGNQKHRVFFPGHVYGLMLIYVCFFFFFLRRELPRLQTIFLLTQGRWLKLLRGAGGKLHIASIVGSDLEQFTPGFHQHILDSHRIHVWYR